MSQLEKKIGELIREIAGTNKPNQFGIMSGKVVAGSVDEDNVVCSVVCSIDDDDSPTEEVLLNAVSLNNKGVVCYPADGSNVLVTEVDGPGKYAVVSCSNLVKLSVIIGGTSVTVIDGEVKFNDGSNGGVPITPALVTRYNTLENDNNSLKIIMQAMLVITGALPPAAPVLGSVLTSLFALLAPYAGLMLVPTVRLQIEDTKVKH